jgi:hypothetical protein
VLPKSAASAAGLQSKDVIIGADGQSIAHAADLTAYIRGRHFGDTVTLQVLRSSANSLSELSLVATLGSAGPPASKSANAAPAQPPVVAHSLKETASAAPTEAQASAGRSVQWVSFTEPDEQAFSTEVPQGWMVAGSVARRAALGPTPYLRLLSPDRQAYIVLGDPSITLFTTPLRSTSTRPAWQGQVIRAYESSISFARDYVTQILPAVCAQVSVTAQKERPDLTQGPWARANPDARHSGGEVSFTCRRGDTQMFGTVEAETYINPGPANIGGATWTVDLLAGHFAPPGRQVAVRTLMEHVVKALRYNPQWLRQEQAKYENVLRGINVATNANSKIAQGALASAQRTMQATARQSEAFSRALNGSSPYVDSVGRHFQLDNTKTQWIGPGGRTVGTNGASPGPGWEQLKEIPP